MQGCQEIRLHRWRCRGCEAHNGGTGKCSYVSDVRESLTEILTPIMISNNKIEEKTYLLTIPEYSEPHLWLSALNSA